jgi:recombination protein RecR
METLRKLQQLFKRLPGIGERQAMRFAYFIATSDESYVHELIQNIQETRSNVRRCTRCFALSEKVVAGKCSFCTDEKRDKATLLIVEKDADRERFIQSKTYKGTYFVLGGLAPAIEKEVSTHIRTRELLALVTSESKTDLKEVILALSATPDGDRTEALILVELKKNLGTQNVTSSALGKGLSTGTEIEYSDSDTLLHALQSRTKNA